MIDIKLPLQSLLDPVDHRDWDVSIAAFLDCFDPGLVPFRYNYNLHDLLDRDLVLNLYLGLGIGWTAFLEVKHLAA